MNKNFKILTSILICLSFFNLNFKIASAAQNFDPNYIIGDAEILNYNSMSLEQIQSFLDRRGGYLATYSHEDPDGNPMTAAEIIYDRAITNKISPKFIIVLLQKEMSLIEHKAPTKRQLDWATGYGCPDGSACNPRWEGFWKQINSATLQFHSYMTQPHLYNFKIGETYEFTNSYSTIIKETTVVTPQNQATAALYNYTPHVYNGNYNFYIIWQRYFPMHKNYPDGSLLQAEGEIGVWLIQSGFKRPFLTRGALTSRFDENRIIIVDKSELEAYERGAPIKFPNYSLLRSPAGNIYLLVDDQKRGFDSAEAFRRIGYNPEEVMQASWEDIKAYPEGRPITASSTYPTGALLQNKISGGVYYVIDGEKAPLTDAIFLKTKFKDKKIIPVNPEELDAYLTVDPVLYDDGYLLKSSNSRSVFLIANGQKKAFLSGETFEKMGYRWENVITVSPQLLYLYPEGEAVSANF